MSVLSGKEGYVTINGSDIIELSKWTLDYGADIPEFYSRAGGGAARTVSGAFNGKGDIEVLYNDDTPITTLLVPGTLYTAVFYQGVSDSHTGSLRIGRYSFEVDREGKEERVTIDFVTHGLWTLQAT